MCSVLEHFEKTSTEHFDFAKHEREHRALNFTRAPSTLIIAYNLKEKCKLKKTKNAKRVSKRYFKFYYLT